MKLPEKIIAIDIETTDSDYRAGDIVQIGAVIVNEDLSLGQEFNAYIHPLSTHRSKRAMEVNHISEEILDKAEFPSVVFKKFAEYAHQIGERPMLASWGTYFDVVYMRESHRKLGIEFPFSYRCLDLKTIAIWEMAKNGNTMKGGVHKFLEALGLSFEGTPHDGLDDIKNTMKIIQKLSQTHELRPL